MSKLFCFGIGYSAQALATRLSRQGWTISGTSMTPEGVGRIASLGYEAFLFDGTLGSDALTRALGDSTHLLVSIPPGAKGDPVLARYADAIREARKLEAIAYLSTVGVYGDWQGDWIDEESPTRPLSSRSMQRLTTEQAWLDLGRRSGKRVQLFRLPGIYGPGRSAIDTVRAGTARRVIKPGQVFNRIHVEDIANVVAAAFENGGRHQIYNVADDEPSPPQDVIEFAARLLNLPVPPPIAFEDAGLSPMAASFYAECKRVRNTRMKQDFGVKLMFPTYREGLTALAAR